MSNSAHSSGRLKNSQAQNEDHIISKRDFLKREALNILFTDYVEKDENGDEIELKHFKKASHKILEIRRLRKIIQFNDSVAAILAVAGLCVSTLEYNIYYNGDEINIKNLNSTTYSNEMTDSQAGILIMAGRYKPTPFTTILRISVSISTAILMFFLFIHMRYNYRISVEKGKTPVGKSIFKTSFFRTFIIEVFFNLIHCPPGVNAVFSTTHIDKTMIYSLNTIFNTLMLFRIYLVLRLFAHYTKWRSEQALKYCEMEGCEASTTFALKALLKESPYVSLLMGLMISSILFGLALRNFERPLNEYLGDGVGQDFSFIWNGMWLAVVTMTTELYAQSHFGRLVTFLLIFWGIFLVSLMVVTLENSTSLDSKETRAFNIIFRLKSRKLLKEKGAMIVTHMVRIGGLDRDFKKRLKNAKTQSSRAKVRKEYEEYRSEYMARLEIYKGQYIEEKRNLRSADTDPVEEIKKISLSIDYDFEELRKFLITIREIENNLDALSASHDVILKILKECSDFQQLFKKELLKYKGGIFNIKQYVKG